MLTWPHDQGDWASNLDAIERLYVELAGLIARHERVLIVCRDRAHQAHVQARLAAVAPADDSALRFALAPSDDTWARDHGPITVMDRDATLLLDFQFNGWGNKYPAARDNRITSRLVEAGILQNACRSLDTVLEGGSIDTDGEGTLLTTSRCLLSPARNAHMDRHAWERLFAEAFGIRRTLWLEHGELEGDDTDGHIDMLARFCDTQTLAYTSCERRDDSHYDSLKAMETELKQLRRPDGAPYELVPLPIPAPIRDEDGQRLPASYANFLLINGAVLVPAYAQPEDEIARQRLSACFPQHRIYPLDCRAAIEQHGSLHCLTMQLPRGVVF